MSAVYCSKLFIKGIISKRLFMIIERDKPYKVIFEYVQPFKQDCGGLFNGCEYRPVYGKLKIYTKTESQAQQVIKQIEMQTHCYSCVPDKCLADKLLKILNN